MFSNPGVFSQQSSTESTPFIVFTLNQNQEYKIRNTNGTTDTYTINANNNSLVVRATAFYIYVFTRNGFIEKYDLNGNLQWSVNVGSGEQLLTGALNPDDNYVYAGGEDSNPVVYQVSFSGALGNTWVNPEGRNIDYVLYDSISNVLYVTAGRQALKELDPITLLEVQTSPNKNGDLTLGSSTNYVFSTAEPFGGNPTIFKYQKSNLAQIASNELYSGFGSADDLVIDEAQSHLYFAYIANGTGRLAKLDFNLSIVWDVIPIQVITLLGFFNDIIYAVTTNNEVYTIDKSNGSLTFFDSSFRNIVDWDEIV